MPRTVAGLPSAIMKGGTSCTIFEQPPVMAWRPMRQNWCTAVSPPMTAWSLDLDVAGDGPVVGENHAVPDDAVVGDVAVGEESCRRLPIRVTRVRRGRRGGR